MVSQHAQPHTPQPPNKPNTQTTPKNNFPPSSSPYLPRVVEHPLVGRLLVEVHVLAEEGRAVLLELPPHLFKGWVVVWGLVWMGGYVHFINDRMRQA